MNQIAWFWNQSTYSWLYIFNTDYVQCPYCARRFNEKAAERHINFCKTQQQRIPNKPKVDPRAAAKQNVRTQVCTSWADQIVANMLQRSIFFNEKKN